MSSCDENSHSCLRRGASRRARVVVQRPCAARRRRAGRRTSGPCRPCGPRGVLVRIVGLERELVDADRVAGREPGAVVEERAVDLAHRPARRLGQLLAAAPTPPSPRCCRRVRARTGSTRSGPRRSRSAGRDSARATPESSQSVSAITEVRNTSVPVTAGGASGDDVSQCEPEPMCMKIAVPVSSHAAKNGSQCDPEWIVGSPSLPGSSENATARTPRAALRRTSSAASVGVPQRHDAQRHQPTAGVAGPLLDHPVVVRAHARERELLVGALGEHLPAEARERREAQRRLHVVEVHVGEASLRVVAARAHLVEADRAHPPLATRRSPRTRSSIWWHHSRSS